MRRLWLVLAVAALGLLQACGSATGTGAPGASSGAGQFNKTDVMFVQMMLLHQEPSAQMLRLAEERAVSPELKTLVAAIAVTEADEAKTMRGWLQAWGQPTADPGAHEEHGGLPSNGEAELDTLKNAADADFDRIFLNMFIGRQSYAVQLAQMEAGNGANSDAVALAKRVEQSRNAEIEMMKQMLA